MMLLAIKTLKVRGAFRSALSHSYNGRFPFYSKLSVCSVILSLSVVLEFVEKSFVRPFKSTKPLADE